MKTTGIDAVIDQLETVGKAAKGVAKFALYEGAGTIADAVKAAAGKLPYKDTTVAQIQGAVGITKMRSTADGTETNVGFEGYFGDSGFPIPYFVREVENGTSRIPAHPFVKSTANKYKAQAIAAMEAAGQAKLEEIEAKAGTGGTST